MDSRWLSNAYLVADEAGGTAVFVDSGAPLEPLLEAVQEWRVTPTHVLRTHAHPDHVEHESELGLPVVRHSLETGDLWVDAVPTPGHSDDMVCFVINDHAVFSGDTLFKDAVGGGDFEQIKEAVMDVYMPMPHDRRVLPGHTDETTIGREWEQNPFVRVWRGSEPEGDRAGAGVRAATPHSSCGRPTTTARARPGCASTTARMRSSAAHGWSAASGDRRPAHRGVHRARLVAPRPAARRTVGGDDPRARPGRDAHRPGRRTVPRAARLDRAAAARARDRHVQRSLGARDGGGPARRRPHRRVRGQSRARRIRAGLVRPFAARLEDHAARRAGRSKRSRRSKASSTSSSSTPTRAATPRYYEALLPRLSPSTG